MFTIVLANKLLDNVREKRMKMPRNQNTRTKNNTASQPTLIEK